MDRFAKRLEVGWGDLDANGHMANTAYLSKSADVRMHYFREHGFTWAEFARAGIGPVILKDAVEYRREFHLLDAVDVTLAWEGLSADGSRWILVNEFFREDGQLAARVTSHGGWFHLQARALTAPPPALDAMQRAGPRTSGFTELAGLKR